MCCQQQPLPDTHLIIEPEDEHRRPPLCREPDDLAFFKLKVLLPEVLALLKLRGDLAMVLGEDALVALDALAEVFLCPRSIKNYAPHG